MKTLTRVKSRRSSKSKKNRELRKELGKKLLGYSVAAGAVLTIGTGVAEADAIKTTLGTPEVIGLGGFYNLDIDGDGDYDVAFRAFSIINFTNPYTYSNAALVAGGEFSTFGPNNNQVVASTAFSAANLPSSSAINAALLSSFGATGIVRLGYFSVYSSTPYGYGNFLGKQGFLGVGFDIGGNTHYGWVDVGLNDNASLITIYGWGYEKDPGIAIHAGAGVESQPVPEPATLATLAMGAAGIYALRRGKKRKSLKNATQKEHQNA